MKLISNWRKCWRMFSMWAYAAAGALQGAWLMLAPEQKASVPEQWVFYITIAIMVLGAVGRLVYQPKTHDERGSDGRHR